MEPSFQIRFAFNGSYFKAEIFPLENDSYRVQYQTSGLELKPKITFIKKEAASNNSASSWRQMNEGTKVEDEEFIDAVGRAIDINFNS